ncbi:hypothetical protein M3665_23155 [Bacillus licheniformis]|nr:hypothetical protein [Bacillus licheniformis]
MDDCDFDETHLTGNRLWLALEYAYRPHPRFWRDFDIATVVDAMSRRARNWREKLEKAGRSADALQRQLEETVRRNAFDEANAEMLMALPVPERPKTSHAAFDWILATLAEIGLTAELGFAERDGYDCGTDALLVLHRLQHAQRGCVFHANRAAVPRQTEQAFHAKPSEDSTAKRASIPRQTEQGRLRIIGLPPRSGIRNG